MTVRTDLLMQIEDYPWTFCCPDAVPWLTDYQRQAFIEAIKAMDNDPSIASVTIGDTESFFEAWVTRADPLRLKDVFHGPYEQHAQHHGKRFELLGPVDPTTYDFLEVGPLWRIRLETGEEIEAWPEEIAYDDANEE